MKYIAQSTITGRYWDGKEFKAEMPMHALKLAEHDALSLSSVCCHCVTIEVSELTIDQFNSIIADAQAIQKRNPFGSPSHRAAYDTIRKAVQEFHGKDIGSYE